MKTNKLIILLLLVFCGCAKDQMEKEIEFNVNFTISISPGTCFPEVSDKYVYPIVPGMIEWQTAGSTDEVYGFCQLPEKLLKSISTPALIDALIHAPLFTGFYLLSSNSSALKWHGHYQLFNSAEELFKRKDAGDALVAYYKLACFDCTDIPVNIYGEYERMMGLEVLFTKQEIFDKIGHVKKKEVITNLLANYEQRPDYINGIFPMAYLMFADEYAPVMTYSQEYPEKFQMILDGFFYSLDQVDLIISFAKNFIND